LCVFEIGKFLSSLVLLSFVLHNISRLHHVITSVSGNPRGRTLHSNPLIIKLFLILLLQLKPFKLERDQIPFNSLYIIINERVFNCLSIEAQAFIEPAKHVITCHTLGVSRGSRAES
jgi:hypothetical protein